jgi:hypothetical protein
LVEESNTFATQDIISSVNKDRDLAHSTSLSLDVLGEVNDKSIQFSSGSKESRLPVVFRLAENQKDSEIVEYKGHLKESHQKMLIVEHDMIHNTLPMKISSYLKLVDMETRFQKWLSEEISWLPHDTRTKRQDKSCAKGGVDRQSR